MEHEVTQQITNKPCSREKLWLFLFLPFTLLAIVIGAIITPTICRNIERSRIEHERSQDARCRNNLKQLSQVILQYGMDYGNRFPNDDGIYGLKKLHDLYKTDYSVFCCPSAKIGLFNGELTDKNMPYVYFGGFRDLSSEGYSRMEYTPVLFDRPGNHKDHINFINMYEQVVTFNTKARTCSEFIEELSNKNKFTYDPKILKTLREKAAEADRRYYSQQK